MTGILHALSDPVRLGIVMELMRCKAERGQSCVETSTNLDFAMPKSTCSQHYQILREAGLIRCERSGVELLSRVRGKELQARFPGLLESILKSRRKETEG